MSHNQFILSYQKGALGCVVGTRQAVALFCSDRVYRPKVKSLFGLLSLIFLGFCGACIFLLAHAPLVLAIGGSILTLAISFLVVAHRVAELVIAFAMTDGAFFALAVERRVLLVWNDEENCPTVANQDSPRARRSAQR
jgi:hypothetical protein